MKAAIYLKKKAYNDDFCSTRILAPKTGPWSIATKSHYKNDQLLSICVMHTSDTNWFVLLHGIWPSIQGCHFHTSSLFNGRITRTGKTACGIPLLWLGWPPVPHLVGTILYASTLAWRNVSQLVTSSMAMTVENESFCRMPEPIRATIRSFWCVWQFSRTVGRWIAVQSSTLGRGGGGGDIPLKRCIRSAVYGGYGEKGTTARQLAMHPSFWKRGKNERIQDYAHHQHNFAAPCDVGDFPSSNSKKHSAGSTRYKQHNPTQCTPLEQDQ